MTNDALLKLIWLSAKDIVFFGDSDLNDPKPVVFCSDVFVGAADAEPLPEDQINAVVGAYVSGGYDGVMKWVAQRRSAECEA